MELYCYWLLQLSGIFVSTSKILIILICVGNILFQLRLAEVLHRPSWNSETLAANSGHRLLKRDGIHFADPFRRLCISETLWHCVPVQGPIAGNRSQNHHLRLVLRLLCLHDLHVLHRSPIFILLRLERLRWRRASIWEGRGIWRS